MKVDSELLKIRPPWATELPDVTTCAGHCMFGFRTRMSTRSFCVPRFRCQNMDAAVCIMYSGLYYSAFWAVSGAEYGTRRMRGIGCPPLLAPASIQDPPVPVPLTPCPATQITCTSCMEYLCGVGRLGMLSRSRKVLHRPRRVP